MESTPHIHGLVIPKLWNPSYEKYTLQAYRYFNGREALTKLQDSYAEAMQQVFPVMQRGIKGSKAQHITVRKWYSAINKELDLNDMESVVAKAQAEEVMRIKMKYIDKTLKSFLYHKTNAEEEVKKLLKEKEELETKVTELNKKVQVNELDNKKDFKSSKSFDASKRL